MSNEVMVNQSKGDIASLRGAAVSTEPLSDMEALFLRLVYGYVLKTRGKRGSKSAGIHIPAGRGDEVPMCYGSSMENNGTTFSEKTNEVLPHKYIRESSYSYCLDCTEKAREVWGLEERDG